MMIEKGDLLKWLEEWYADIVPMGSYDDWNKGKRSAIDVIMTEIESGTFDVKKGDE